MFSEYEYSDQEQKLIDYFGLTVAAPQTNPLMLYHTMASKAFVMNDQTEYAESLRRCVRHLENGGYRYTPEFDSLILV